MTGSKKRQFEKIKTSTRYRFIMYVFVENKIYIIQEEERKFFRQKQHTYRSLNIYKYIKSLLNLSTVSVKDLIKFAHTNILIIYLIFPYRNDTIIDHDSNDDIIITKLS